MIQDKITQLLNNHNHVTTTLRSISTEIIDLIELGCAGDDEALDKLRQLNSKDHDSINTFLKVSALLLKIFPIEHRIAGTELSKQINHEQLKQSQGSTNFTDTDLSLVKGAVNNYNIRAIR